MEAIEGFKLLDRRSRAELELLHERLVYGQQGDEWRESHWLEIQLSDFASPLGYLKIPVWVWKCGRQCRQPSTWREADRN